MRRVVEQAFCSSWGDDALELLGDLAFQDGRFGEALAMYRQLVPDRPDDAFSLIHPDPSVDLARVAAKKLLCRAAARREARRSPRRSRLSRAVPRRVGTLAGRKGPYATDPRGVARSTTISRPPASPTAAGPPSPASFTRTKVVAEPIDVGSLQWRVALERITVDATRLAATAARSMTTNASSPPGSAAGLSSRSSWATR